MSEARFAHSNVNYWIFSDSFEESVSDFIIDNYIEPGNYFPDSSFKNLIFQAYNMDDEIRRDFHCSPGFIVDFKNRNRFSSRIAHAKRRPDIQLSDEDAAKFVSDIKNIITEAKSKNEPVVNADETGWRILPSHLRTWALKNSKNIIIKAHDDEHANISAMASITADLTKLPLFLIASGKKTEDMEKQLGDDIYPHFGTFSSSAFMTTDCFIEYLKFLRSLFPEEKTIHLIVDSYSTHKSGKSKLVAEELNISLTFIPDGYTDKYQPLDIAVFGALKSIANAKLAQFLIAYPDYEITMEKSVEKLIESWDAISAETIEKGWIQYI